MSDETKDTSEEVEIPPAPESKTPSLLRNYISLAGIAIAAASLTSIGLLILMELSSGVDNPYTVLVTYILLPGVLVFGIFLMIVGALLERRKRRKYPDSHIPAYPVIDLNDPSRRRTLIMFLFARYLPVHQRFWQLPGVRIHRVGTVLRAAMSHGDEARIRRIQRLAARASRLRRMPRRRRGGMVCQVEAQRHAPALRRHVPYITTSRSRRRFTTCGPPTIPVHKCHWPEKFYGDQTEGFQPLTATTRITRSTRRGC